MAKKKVRKIKEVEFSFINPVQLEEEVVSLKKYLSKKRYTYGEVKLLLELVSDHIDKDGKQSKMSINISEIKGKDKVKEFKGMMELLKKVSKPKK